MPGHTKKQQEHPRFGPEVVGMRSVWIDRCQDLSFAQFLKQNIKLDQEESQTYCPLTQQGESKIQGLEHADCNKE